MCAILKSERDDPDSELDFELGYQLSLSTQERFEVMFRRSREMAEILLRNGHRKPIEIVERS